MKFYTAEETGQELPQIRIMTQQEIQERNKQIALMLGKKEQLEYWKQWVDIESKLKWHSDWNWLMEAVDFIEKQKMEVSIIQNECSIIDTEKAEQEENPFMIEPVAKCYDGETKKEAVFIAVSDFAKKFNNKEL
jgi:hypothetical protein